MSDDIRNLLQQITPDQIRVDQSGRVFIDAPELAAKLKDVAKLPSDALNDTNIICCGNDKCGRGDDLGSLVERFSRGMTR